MVFLLVVPPTGGAVITEVISSVWFGNTCVISDRLFVCVRNAQPIVEYFRQQ